jgi:8-oxo-dGTP pyrophosphatase MutT (NUDIX family)
MQTLVRRDTARVILIDPDDRVLLFRNLLPSPWQGEGWLTPGGALDPGETAAAAAARELREETGQSLTAARLGAPVAITSGRWESEHTAYEGLNWHFYARTATSAVDIGGQDDEELEVMLGYRWWNVAELRDTGELILPVGLHTILPALIDDRPPADPVELAWT